MTDEIETLRRELAETRAVLEDLMHEKRPNDTWLLKLIGRRDDLVQVVRNAYDAEYEDSGTSCAKCFSDPCEKDCFRFEFLAVNDVEWLAEQIEKAHETAIAEDLRRFPMYGPPNRPINHTERASMWSRLFRESYAENIVSGWSQMVQLVPSPNVPDGTAYIMPNMSVLDGPAPTPEHSRPESPHLARESDKTTDKGPQI